MYKDEKGHFTDKEHANGPCTHEGGKKSLEDLDKEGFEGSHNNIISKMRNGGYDTKEEVMADAKKWDLNEKQMNYISEYTDAVFGEDSEKPSKKKFYIGTLDDKYGEVIEAENEEEANRIAQEKLGSHAGGDEVYVEEASYEEDLEEEDKPQLSIEDAHNEALKMRAAGKSIDEVYDHFKQQGFDKDTIHDKILYVTGSEGNSYTPKTKTEIAVEDYFNKNWDKMNKDQTIGEMAYKLSGYIRRPYPELLDAVSKSVASRNANIEDDYYESDITEPEEPSDSKGMSDEDKEYWKNFGLFGKLQIAGIPVDSILRGGKEITLTGPNNFEYQVIRTDKGFNVIEEGEFIEENVSEDEVFDRLKQIFGKNK